MVASSRAGAHEALEYALTPCLLFNPTTQEVAQQELAIHFFALLCRPFEANGGSGKISAIAASFPPVLVRKDSVAQPQRLAQDSDRIGTAI